jgi:hypothetical protein
MNPTAPNLHATLRVHKYNTPIRQTINWTNDPAYELPKQVSKLLHSYLQLAHTYDIRNSIHLMTDLQAIKLNKDMRLCSFDVENMYTNIRKIGIINTINTIIENNHEIYRNDQKEIIHILKTVQEQNYFRVDQEYYKQTDRLALASPTSSILAQTYTEHMEHTQTYPILIKQQIVAYFRYIDDIRIIYDKNSCIEDIYICINATRCLSTILRLLCYYLL